MDVRTVRDKAPIVEHNGTTPVWWLISPREMLEQTQGRPSRADRGLGDRRRRRGVPAPAPDTRVLLRAVRPRPDGGRGRGARDLGGRPRLYPAGQGAQRQDDQPACRHQGRLVRRGRAGRRPHRLHHALSRSAPRRDASDDSPVRWRSAARARGARCLSRRARPMRQAKRRAPGRRLPPR